MKLKHPIRIVTATSLFDGHDASINMMRRLLQDSGAEVIHLGHNCSVEKIVHTVLQEGAQGLCVSSYQGGHLEYFKYTKDLLKELGADYVKIFGGGGGVIIHEEKRELEDYGISKIFHPDDGRRMGLQGMTDFILKSCDFDINEAFLKTRPQPQFKGFPHRDLGLLFSAVENEKPLKEFQNLLSEFPKKKNKAPILGITGTGGAGKSSLIDELVQRFLNFYSDVHVAVICVDPTKRKTGGALLGDRIRINSLKRPGVYMRSLASRGSGNEISGSLPQVLQECQKLNFDLIIAESSGIGQGSVAITEVSDLSLYVMTSEFGAQTQLEKIEMIDHADFITINKSDRRNAQDAFRDVRKQYKRAHKLFEEEESSFPVYLTQASHFNDIGVNQLFLGITKKLKSISKHWEISDEKIQALRSSEKQTLIPPEKQNYLAQIVDTVKSYKERTKALSQKASVLGALKKVEEEGLVDQKTCQEKQKALEKEFSPEELEVLNSYESERQSYQKESLVYKTRKENQQPLFIESLSGLKIPRICYPELTDWGERFSFLRLENVPGKFPFTAGVFPLKKKDELPGRQFAGEGTPEKTNKRFHYLSQSEPAKRLSTAFDSVTLYGEDPHKRPDIYGKVGESGVSVASLEDMKRLYKGFNLCDPSTSVSMTINGPAPMILAFFLNTALDQQMEIKEKELGRSLNKTEKKEVKAFTLQTVRGTVQADILKEDQGQNTCIFSIDFALKMMGDIQEYFIQHNVRNFYSVSISGYHIAEAGANPITQLAFTLSNAFTYIEYYLSRGMDIDKFAPNLSFFFSNGLDPEYTVLGRVARRIWAIALKELYGANTRSQKLKYHIQTSGRSLHAQEISFNDIRTTLQALVAISDHCNSLHTNAYDEAITTPTQESVRIAQAIQLIINKEFGYSKNENPLQGSYFIEHLTHLVEEAVLEEFLKINQRGGVLGAMETQYQRGKIQEESLYYETLKHNGKLPLVGVNTFIDPKTLKDDYVPEKIEMARASREEKSEQLKNTKAKKEKFKKQALVEKQNLKQAVLENKNIFEALMKASRVLTLSQMSEALYEVGGEYRRNL